MYGCDYPDEPLIKFNSGIDGVASDVMFNQQNEQHPKGPVVAMYEYSIAPAIRSLMWASKLMVGVNASTWNGTPSRLSDSR